MSFLLKNMSHDIQKTFLLDRLIVTMIFTLKSVLHRIHETFFLSSISKLVPTIPSERFTHRKVTINTDQTGGIKEILTLLRK